MCPHGETIRCQRCNDIQEGRMLERWESESLIATDWYCHPTVDGKRLYRFHDKASVHMDGCIPVYVKACDIEGRLNA